MKEKNSRGICWRSSARNDETVSLFFSCRHFLLLSLPFRSHTHTQTTAETLCVLYKREEEEKLCQSVNNCFGIFWTNNGRVNSSNKKTQKPTIRSVFLFAINQIRQKDLLDNGILLKKMSHHRQSKFPVQMDKKILKNHTHVK